MKAKAIRHRPSKMFVIEIQSDEWGDSYLEPDDLPQLRDMEYQLPKKLPKYWALSSDMKYSDLELVTIQFKLIEP